MTIWAITVKAPVSRLSLEGEVATFARSLPDRPAHRAGNVVGYELYANTSSFSTEPGQHALLLLTVDSGASGPLEGLVKELTEKLDQSYPLEELVVSGIELNVVEKSTADSH